MRIVSSPPEMECCFACAVSAEHLIEDEDEVGRFYCNKCWADWLGMEAATHTQPRPPEVTPFTFVGLASPLGEEGAGFNFGNSPIKAAFSFGTRAVDDTDDCTKAADACTDDCTKAADACTDDCTKAVDDCTRVAVDHASGSYSSLSHEGEQDDWSLTIQSMGGSEDIEVKIGPSETISKLKKVLVTATGAIPSEMQLFLEESSNPLSDRLSAESAGLVDGATA